MNRVLVRDLVLALSIANLLVMRSWALLAWPRNHYFLGSPPGADGVAAVLLCMFSVAALLFIGGRRLGRESATAARRRAGWLTLSFLVIVGVNGLRQQVHGLSGSAVVQRTGEPLALTLAAAGAAALAWWVQRTGIYGLARVAERVALGLAPLVVVTTGLTLWQLSPFEAEHYRDQTPTPAPTRHAPQARVLLVIFDGLDQELLFDARPSGDAAPAFDAFRARALSWQNAYPPSCSTLVSLPAILTGRALKGVEPTGPDELRLTSDSLEPVDWRRDNLFSKAQAQGAASALIGWYHPYCRILGNQVSRCSWRPYVRPPTFSIAARVRDVAVGMLESVPGAYRLMRKGGFRPSGVSVEPEWHATIFRAVHSETLRAIGDGALDFIFVHYPIPHEPNIFDRRAGRLNANADGTYADNLALADRTLGELLAAVDSSERAGETTIIVSADHGLRRPEAADRCEGFPVIGNVRHRVPLLIHFAQQDAPVVRREVIRTHHLGSVAIGALDGSVRDADGAVSLLLGR